MTKADIVLEALSEPFDVRCSCGDKIQGIRLGEMSTAYCQPCRHTFEVLVVSVGDRFQVSGPQLGSVRDMFPGDRLTVDWTR